GFVLNSFGSDLSARQCGYRIAGGNHPAELVVIDLTVGAEPNLKGDGFRSWNGWILVFGKRRLRAGRL
ncbi:MAG: hypothetical protein VKK94_07140, partial [Cyanobacteriota bacterium]|nr:hypothetical protein [Cyanobacteriota bacterium]